MNVLGNRCEVRREQGFALYVLNNQEVELAVVPELGARLISLKDLGTGREWMWHPGGRRNLFRNRAGDDFAAGSLVGMDECLPTIASCSWQGQALPDHGEVWAAPWAVDAAAWEQGVLRTSVKLKILPLTFERTIELQGNELRLGYRLTNQGATQESFLWAMHPLLRLEAADRLELPASTRALLNGSAWVNPVHSAIPEGRCEKVFASPITEGRAAISNPRTADRLEFEWDPTENNTLGLWLTRGGWHGHHHFALEPANGEPDDLALAAQRKRCGVVTAHGAAAWQVTLRVGG